MHLMARRWFKQWCTVQVNEAHEVFETEVLEVLRASSRVDAALRHNSTQHAGSLYQLPEDLLSMICQYLTRAEVVTLMLSCTRFWNSRMAVGVFARTWQQIMLPIGKEYSKIEERFYILRMLEYDGLLQRGSPSKYCCWGCMKMHEQRAFSPEEFKKIDLNLKQDCYPEEAFRRSCELAKRYIWMGRQREMTFGELRHILANRHTQRLLEGWIYPEGNDNFLFWICSYEFNLGPHRNIQLFSDFKRAMRGANGLLCPHLRLDDSKVAELGLAGVKVKVCSCKHCTTTVQIIFSLDVRVMVYRYLGSLHSPTDPAWVAQSYRKRVGRLKASCYEFIEWSVRMFGPTEVYVAGERPRRFEPKRIRRPLQGLASCTPEWPEGYPRLQGP